LVVSVRRVRAPTHTQIRTVNWTARYNPSKVKAIVQGPTWNMNRGKPGVMKGGGKTMTAENVGTSVARAKNSWSGKREATARVMITSSITAIWETLWDIIATTMNPDNATSFTRGIDCLE